ncbi:MAG: amidohydrolase family protein [Candidatus Rokubacteria bacterium]|nr:amidohydrolase family protein [Candidatus Rokubacteria bacterium]
MTVITSPLLCGHLLGMLIRDLGADHVLWGTDSIWWGSPQWQIEAFRRFTMPETLRQRFGYAPLTRDIKDRILGLNAAALFGVDPAARRNPMPPTSSRASRPRTWRTGRRSASRNTAGSPAETRGFSSPRLPPAHRTTAPVYRNSYLSAPRVITYAACHKSRDRGAF